MTKKNKKHQQRVKKLFIICCLCAIILTVSTYAWFVGMKTVNVSSFDVSIASIDSLELSLDGVTWKDTVEIDKDHFSSVNTSNNTNSWGGDKGLIPISTVGKISDASSRLVMYEKGSIATTAGGYRLMASKVDNSAEEKPGYVAFDLFIRNKSGDEYYKTLDINNEEDIYLTTDSEVKANADGITNTGIENSVRVAFAQIGRVKATENTQSKITGISCTSDDTDVTKICATRDAQIWEPNDTKHQNNAIEWYKTSCKERYTSGTIVTNSASYNTAANSCNTIVDGTSYHTYAVSGVIDEESNVDVYDGADYNKYTGSIATTAQDDKLVAFNYFTDAKKNTPGVDRETFFKLAPNSITKVRVYIYIEGQDIDNYDFASLGKQISISFGFTKERYFDADVNYSGSATLPDDVRRASHPLKATSLTSGQ